MQDLTKITTPFGLLDPETQAALKAHGGPYEVYDEGDKWFTHGAPGWHDSSVYRVKPVALVPDSIDWSHVAEGFDWMAQDKCGDVYVYNQRPDIGCYGWVSKYENCRRIDDLIPSYRRGTVDWRDSLVRRPE